MCRSSNKQRAVHYKYYGCYRLSLCI